MHSRAKTAPPRFEDGRWNAFYEGTAQDDCYTTKAALGPRGDSVLLQHSCPPGSRGDNVRQSLHRLAADASTYAVTCPVEPAP